MHPRRQGGAGDGAEGEGEGAEGRGVGGGAAGDEEGGGAGDSLCGNAMTISFIVSKMNYFYWSLHFETLNKIIYTR